MNKHIPMNDIKRSKKTFDPARILVAMLCWFVPGRRARKRLRERLLQPSTHDLLIAEIRAIKSILHVHFDITKAPPATGPLRKVQLGALKVLVAVTSLLEREKIPYFLHGGTLLGACRHGGFIPWDDDIDIGVMRDGYDRLLEILKDTRSAHFSHQSVFRETFLKIIHNQTLSEIDIFPFEKDADGNLYKYYPDEYHWNAKNIFPLALIKFEDHVFFAPRNATVLLSDMYGDWMAYPRDMYSRHGGQFLERVKHAGENSAAFDRFISAPDDELLKMLKGEV